MSVNAAGSAQNVQQAVTALRQTVQAEQVAASAVVEASKQVSQEAAQASAKESAAKAEGVGEHLDVEA